MTEVQLYWQAQTIWVPRGRGWRRRVQPVRAMLLYSRFWYERDQPHSLKQRVLKCRIIPDPHRDLPPYMLVTQKRGEHERVWRFEEVREAQDFGEGWASEVMDLIEREPA